MSFLFRGRFAQGMELLSIILILVGIIALCQPFSLAVFRIGFGILLTGWIGLTLFSHRTPVREIPEETRPSVPVQPH